ncbi:MAG: anthranilate 1,2-dioxygenase [Alphaproteobacteria bacterium]|jgi:anthranilate 1,2-dioxygenase small subunit|nr:anthranilate 1,2-dioxygenase [Alphaproteobacteria bacterium]
MGVAMAFDKATARDLHQEVEDLVARHAELIDEDRLEEWPDLFTEDCVYKIIARENMDRGLPIAAIFCDSRKMLVDRVVSLRQANIYPTHHYRHILSTTRVHEVEPGLVRARTNYVVFQTRNNGETSIYNAGRYLDEIVRGEDGQLRFKSKLAVFDTNRIDTLMVRPI